MSDRQVLDEVEARHGGRALVDMQQINQRVA